MTEFNIKKIDSTLLFLVICLMKEYERARANNSWTHRGENFFSFIGFGHTDYLWKKIPDEEWSKYLIDLCVEFGVVREIYFDILDESWDLKNPLKSKHYKYGITDPLDSFNLGISPGKDHTLFSSIDLDYEKIEKFISEYLSRWLNDDLILQGKNLLKAEKQIEKVVGDIYRLLHEHPDKNLLVENILYEKDVDFIATIFFLEKSTYLEILNIDATEYQHWFVRINLYRKFYEDFKCEGFFLDEIVFDFHYLKTGKKAITRDKKGNGIKLNSEQKPLLQLTEDGKLLFPGYEPIFDLSELQKLLCKELFSREKGYNHKTIDLEEKVYGDEPTKNRQDKFKKLVYRFNEIVQGQFKISEAIRYGSNTTRRLL